MNPKEQWYHAEVERLKSENTLLGQKAATLESKVAKLEGRENGFRSYINELVWKADNVLKLQFKYFKGGRTDYDKKKSIEAEVSLRLTIDKALKKGYGHEAPPSNNIEQGKLL